MRSIIKEGWGAWVFLSMIAAFLVVFAWQLGILSPLERPVSDVLLRIPSPRSAGSGPFSAVLIDDRTVSRFGQLPWPREQLADLINGVRALGAKGIVVDILLSDPGFEPADFSLEKTFEKGPTILAASLDSNGMWILPAGVFGGMRRAAHANAEIEGDGVIRSISFTKQSGDVSLEAMSVAAARIAGWQGVSTPGVAFRPDFLRRPSQIPQLSAIDILDPIGAPALLEDQVVFVGISATGSTDQFVTPVSRWHRPTPGVLVHAAAASSLFRGGLVQPLNFASACLAAFLAALFMQALRSAAGRLRAWHLAVVALTIVGCSLVVFWTLQLSLPIVGLLSAATISAFLREVVESRNVQSETGKILHSLLREGRSDVPPPKGAQERLRVTRLLQERIIHDRNLRRTLLDGLSEGVIMWGGDGRPLVSNQAFRRLWGEIPSLSEMLHNTGTSQREPVADPTQTAHIEHLRRSLEIRYQNIDDGHLAVVRDRSTEKELDKQRREMQRLVSHELKTPLASLAGFGSLLERYTLTDEELRHTAGLIRTEAERLGEMVRTFLDLERLDEAVQAEEHIAVDLAALVEERCSILSAFSRESNVQLSVKVDRPALVTGLPVLLGQVIDNLVGNAVKFAPPDSLVNVEIVDQENTVIFRVSDSGPGIPPEAIPHLFERFYRVPGSGKQGTGLGLALVREVAEHHQAEVEVASTPGEGSTFTVEFPALGVTREPS